MEHPPDANLPKVLSVLELLTEQELQHLNEIVVARLRLMRQIRDHSQMIKFRVGQRVKFTHSKTGQVIQGYITRMNRNSVSLVTDDKHEWRVAPSMLNPVE